MLSVKTERLFDLSSSPTALVPFPNKSPNSCVRRRAPDLSTPKSTRTNQSSVSLGDLGVLGGELHRRDLRPNVVQSDRAQSREISR